MEDNDAIYVKIKKKDLNGKDNRKMWWDSGK